VQIEILVSPAGIYHDRSAADHWVLFRLLRFIDPFLRDTRFLSVARAERGRISRRATFVHSLTAKILRDCFPLLSPASSISLTRARSDIRLNARARCRAHLCITMDPLQMNIDSDPPRGLPLTAIYNAVSLFTRDDETSLA